MRAQREHRSIRKGAKTRNWSAALSSLLLSFVSLLADRRAASQMPSISRAPSHESALQSPPGGKGNHGVRGNRNKRRVCVLYLAHETMLLCSLAFAVCLLVPQPARQSCDRSVTRSIGPPRGKPLCTYSTVP
ncbi:hypothetical protein IE81DRAFT_172321 [Ceraceosorus guamensis]|uniref:Uncharacterized protein n=1 Tax=Ceraceosorus guamensis TaxID=1522189 RepID=A0A316VXD1_9BASI|nr:hypothetical protein IE81DRAFT_172321 [Ceraceosorus guamensis]PWN41578.1 hypothetical protein IE81DRAFT_172321 [Ceraceosorus guamensis]